MSAGHFCGINPIILIAVVIIGGAALYFKFGLNSLYFPLVILAGIISGGYFLKGSPEIPDKIIPPIEARITGKIEKILKSGENYSRFLVNGRLDSKIAPPSEQKILLTVAGKGNSGQFKEGAIISARIKLEYPKKANLPDEFDSRSYLANLDAAAVGMAFSSQVSLIKNPGDYSKIKTKIISGVNARVDSLFPEKDAPLVKAILLGDKTGIPFETKKEFSYAGTAHLLAVSGLHVGLIAAVLFFALNFVGNNWVKFVLFTLLISGFVIISGMQPSAVRAGSMAILYTFMIALQRKARPINIFAVVILIELLIYPAIIKSISFQMSVFAVAGILLFTNHFYKFFKHLFPDKFFFRYVSGSLAVTFSATFITGPLVAYYFGVFSIISPLANLVVIPLMSLVLIYSFLSLIISFISFGAAGLFSAAASMLSGWSLDINKWVSSFDFAYLAGELALPVAAIASLATVWIALNKSARPLSFRIAVSLVAVLIITQLTSKNEIPGLRVFQRTELSVIEFPIDSGKKFIALLDRKHYRRPAGDFALENYLENLPDSLILGVSGNAGIKLSDNLKEKRDFNYVELSLDDKLKIGGIAGNKYIFRENNIR
jgi:ComEC/Rec2-related protein